MDGFDNHNEMYFCYLFFIGATFVTQVVFLNMLIAIMGNTFDQVIERRAQYALVTKLSILSEYYYVINERLADQKNDTYLFIARPKIADGEDEDQAWEGGFSFIKNIISREIKALGLNFGTQLTMT